MTRPVLWHAYQAAAATNGRLVGGEEWAARGLSIDTRTIEPGDLFIALKADRDGHDFVAQAFEKGASAALVSREVEGGPQLRVADTLEALEALAEVARDRNVAPRVGVTGSAGKTTTKEMLRHALAPLGQVHAADKSFNNHIGVPLTVASLPQAADVGVFEMGMNHAGEIRHLTSLVRPHIAIITTIAEAHLENLGSLEAIADAKAEIAEGLIRGGVMILPADSPFLPRLRQRVGEVGVTKVETFGRAGQEARLVSVDETESGMRVVADILGESVTFLLAAQGEHMANNAVAALLAAVRAGADLQAASVALGGFSTGAGRGARFTLLVDGKRVTVLDESYNANPASMRASLGVLSRQSGRKIAVLGDMLELGETAPQLHAGLAEAAGIADVVHTAGPLMQHLRDALPAGRRGSHRDNAADLLQDLLGDISEGDTVLFKGSNASRVGALVEAFLKVGQKT